MDFEEIRRMDEAYHADTFPRLIIDHNIIKLRIIVRYTVRNFLVFEFIY